MQAELVTYRSDVHPSALVAFAEKDLGTLKTFEGAPFFSLRRNPKMFEDTIMACEVMAELGGLLGDHRYLVVTSELPFTIIAIWQGSEWKIASDNESRKLSQKEASDLSRKEMYADFERRGMTPFRL